MNRSCCHAGFPQEGIYVSFNSDLSDPMGWKEPEKLLGGVFWYPQVLGTGPQETDSIAGEHARLYVFGESKWELVFHKSGDEITVDPEIPEPEPDEPAPEPTTLEPEPPAERIGEAPQEVRCAIPSLDCVSNDSLPAGQRLERSGVQSTQKRHAPLQ
jgi:hypothetical protein